MSKIKAENAPAYVRHCENLCKLAGIEVNFWEGHKLYQKLRRLELKAHRFAEQECNGEIKPSEERENAITLNVLKLLPNAKSFFLNGDPRGYALKVANGNGFVRSLDLYRDLGGYGILAPEF